MWGTSGSSCDLCGDSTLPPPCSSSLEPDRGQSHHGNEQQPTWQRNRFMCAAVRQLKAYCALLEHKVASLA